MRPTSSQKPTRIAPLPLPGAFTRSYWKKNRDGSTSPPDFQPDALRREGGITSVSAWLSLGRASFCGHLAWAFSSTRFARTWHWPETPTACFVVQDQSYTFPVLNAVGSCLPRPCEKTWWHFQTATEHVRGGDLCCYTLLLAWRLRRRRRLGLGF